MTPATAHPEPHGPNPPTRNPARLFTRPTRRKTRPRPDHHGPLLAGQTRAPTTEHRRAPRARRTTHIARTHAHTGVRSYHTLRSHGTTPRAPTERAAHEHTRLPWTARPSLHAGAATFQVHIAEFITAEPTRGNRQEHPGFFRGTVSLVFVALSATAHQAQPRVLTTARPRHHVLCAHPRPRAFTIRTPRPQPHPPTTHRATGTRLTTRAPPGTTRDAHPAL